MLKKTIGNQWNAQVISSTFPWDVETLVDLIVKVLTLANLRSNLFEQIISFKTNAQSQYKLPRQWQIWENAAVFSSLYVLPRVRILRY